ncbi:MAG: hypothetical protein UW79_C0008G0018 [Candidatus Yanofskybacteria bacterium GW2011_GWA2_44_9]|uniref:Uncharacterized protein n=1 Tax=Candidatus Yanofskybacteria bacterium GW2011_GWA2_44_9 TaxID=1619025 RepID=A0A0G1NDS5_9BACT|nr:MAG: hypothetical protein UW79_C0008G0018 [Candidatus Yanofskybacteria bacterium GW2011_GWA2_44_9]
MTRERQNRILCATTLFGVWGVMIALVLSFKVNRIFGPSELISWLTFSSVIVGSIILGYFMPRRFILWLYSDR